MVTRFEIRVDGMKCAGCERGLVAALSFLEGVRDVEASSRLAIVRGNYDSTRLSLADVRHEITSLAYEVVS